MTMPSLVGWLEVSRDHKDSGHYMCSVYLVLTNLRSSTPIGSFSGLLIPHGYAPFLIASQVTNPMHLLLVRL